MMKMMMIVAQTTNTISNLVQTLNSTQEDQVQVSQAVEAVESREELVLTGRVIQDL